MSIGTQTLLMWKPETSDEPNSEPEDTRPLDAVLEAALSAPPVEETALVVVPRTPLPIVPASRSVGLVPVSEPTIRLPNTALIVRDLPPDDEDVPIRLPRKRGGQFALIGLGLFLAMVGVRLVGEASARRHGFRPAIPAVELPASEPAPGPLPLAMEAAPRPEPAAKVPARANAPSRPRAVRPMRDVVWSDRQQGLVTVELPAL
jgi:hypothetical protein